MKVNVSEKNLIPGVRSENVPEKVKTSIEYKPTNITENITNMTENVKTSIAHKPENTTIPIVATNDTSPITVLELKGTTLTISLITLSVFLLALVIFTLGVLCCCFCR